MILEVIWYIISSIIFLIVLHFLPFIWLHIRRPTNWSKYSNKWAIVIGASEGLGEEFAVGLAKRGMHIILIARTESKLKLVAKRIQSETQQHTKIIIADILDKNWINSLSIAINSLDIAFLLNNAGGTLGKKPFREFLDYTPEEIENYHQFNTGYVIQSIRLVLPIFLQKRFGGILNISSLAAMGSLYLIPYSSEKAKLNSLTESLALEYQDYGVIIQCASAGRILTPTYMSRLNKENNWRTPLPRLVAESALNMFGAGGPNVIPYWGHDVQARMLKIIGIFRLGLIVRVYKKLKKTTPE